MNFWDGELAEHEGELAFWGCRCPVRLDAAIRGRLQPSGLKKVTLGIRPEDVALQIVAPRLADDALIGRVLLVEPLGESNLTYVEVLGAEDGAAGHGPTLTARTGREQNWQVDQRVAIELSHHRMHLFDAATGESLTRGVRTASTSQKT
jgi:ABC-type sugar transport system ATPase subunit